MDSFFVRYRNHLVLLTILAAQLIGLGVQVRHSRAGRNSLDASDSSGVRLIRFWAESLVSPPERLIHGMKTGADDLWTGYLDLRHVRQQNLELEQTIGRLRLEQAALLEDARQGQRLQALLGFQQRYIYSTVAAQVFGTSGSDQSRVFYIDKGSDNGLARDMAVVTADGIVGKVRDVFPHNSQVLAINDQTSGAGVLLETTRIRGILKGNASGQLEVVGVLADERIKAGEQVVTAGGDLVFPRGLPVGVVSKVASDSDNPAYIDVMVKSAANLDRLDEVLVITSMQPRFSEQEKQDMATSQALDGAQAAAVDQQIQEQQKAAQITAERLPGLILPNVPPDQQPINDSSPPNPISQQQQPPSPLHPDEFSPAPGDKVVPGVSDDGAASTVPAAAKKKIAAPENPNVAGNAARNPHASVPPAGRPASTAQPQPVGQPAPRRNP
jgi:rod shape-determining protein MreC